MVFFNTFDGINHPYGADAVLIVNCSKCLCNAQFLNHCKRYNCDDPLITSIIVINTLSFAIYSKSCIIMNTT